MCPVIEAIQSSVDGDSDIDWAMEIRAEMRGRPVFSAAKGNHISASGFLKWSRIQACNLPSHQ
jgi:hypothetical protein